MGSNDGTPSAPVEFEALLACCGEHLSISLDVRRRAFWFVFHPKPVPCFNPGILKEVLSVQRQLVQSNCRIAIDGQTVTLICVAVASRSKGVFNLGGDLELFCQLIDAQDREGLFQYAKDCIDTIYFHLDGYGAHIATVSLVQGLALGGGMECALASEHIVAEEQAEFGLPELLFNLFPGMGAFNLLATRVSPRVADSIVLASKKHPASEMKELGVINALIPTGTGTRYVNDWIEASAEKHAALRRIKRTVFPVTYAELIGSITEWVDAAMGLDKKDLRMIQVLRKRQSSSYG